MKDIYSYPIDERPRVAVARFKVVQGEFLFQKLLKHLNLDYEEFIQEYGEKLLANPNCLTETIVEMMTAEFRRMRACSK